jgi:hypothetical protein
VNAASATDALNPAVRELYEHLVERATIRPDGRQIVAEGSATLARKLGKSPATLTKQIGILRGHGLVSGDARGTIELSTGPASQDRNLRAVTTPRPADPIVPALITLARLAENYPEHRQGIAAAIAIVATANATNRDGEARSSTGVEEEKNPCLSSYLTSHMAQDVATRRDADRDSDRDLRIAGTTIEEVRAVMSPLLEAEQRRRPNIPITLARTTAAALTWLTAEQLARGIQRAEQLMQHGEIESAVSLLIARGRARDLSLFVNDNPHEAPSTATPTSDETAAGDTPEDPDAALVTDFQNLPPAEQARYLEQATTDASDAVRRVMKLVPAVQHRTAALLWHTQRSRQPDDSHHSEQGADRATSSQPDVEDLSEAGAARQSPTRSDAPPPDLVT